MATRSDELTHEIEATRGRMDRTLDDLGERAGPGRLTERMRGAVGNARDTVMGTAGQTGQHLASDASSAGSSAKGALRRTTDGNPLAAGLVAFGAGLLAGSVLPESRTENALAHEVQRKAQAPVREQLKESAGAVTDQVGSRVEEAKEAVVEEGRHAKDEVASDVGQRVGAVQEHAHEAAEDVRGDVHDEAERLRQQAKDEARHHSGQ